MKKLLPILTHPLTLSIFITFLIVWLLFPLVPKYELKLKEHILRRDFAVEYYDDLDGNGYSDRILFTRYPKDVMGVTVLFNPSVDLQEWQPRGHFVSDRLDNFCTGDYDGNGQREIYVFTVIHDSLFLHCISRLFDKPVIFFSRFIQVVGDGNADSLLHGNIAIGGLEDMNRDGYKELVFAINFGISTIPRSICIYDIKNDILTTAPKNGYFIQNLLLEDLNGDGTREIIVNGYACQTCHDSIAFPLNDLSCWLIVLDNRLQYLFPPRCFNLRGYSNLSTVAIAEKSGRKSLFSLYGPPLASKQNCILYHFDQQGNILKKKEIPGALYRQLYDPVVSYKMKVPYLAICSREGDLFLYDTAFNLVTTKHFPFHFGQIYKRDVDSDMEEEHIGIISPGDKLIVFRQDMSDPALLGITLDGMRINCSLKKEPGQATQLVLNSGPYLYFILYNLNPLYYTRWLIFAGLFVAVYLMILLIAWLQRIRFENRLKTEKKITELQLKIVRNQMDPHFTMNAINALVDAINREEKEQARENLLHFSKMYRSLLLSADKIKRTLREEIDFTENYLALEKFRFGNRFTYEIEIDPLVDLSWEVPKMVIQSPVENAVKHGLQMRDTGGEIRVTARKEDGKLILEITDNGVGRAASAVEGKTSTGKGMEIMEQFFELYYKITGIRVQSMVTDLQDDDGKAAGTKVLVIIPLP